MKQVFMTIPICKYCHSEMQKIKEERGYNIYECKKCLLKGEKVKKKASYKALGLIISCLVIVLYCSILAVNATLTTTLNYPPNNSTFYSNPINFNCSATTDSGSLTNMSLYTNYTGSWILNQTMVPSSITGDISVPNDFTTNGTETNARGMIMSINSTFPNGIIITKSPYSTATKAYIFFNANDTYIGSASFVGDNATINYYLGTAHRYNVVVDKEGATYVNPNKNPQTYNITGNNINFTGGTYCSGTGTTNACLLDSGGGGFKHTIIAIYGLDTTLSVTNNFSNPIPFGTTSWNCLSCIDGGVCNFSSANYTVNNDFNINSVTYNSTTYETSNENYILNFSLASSFTDVTAYFVYNNTVYSSTVLTYTNYKSITNNVSIPIIATTGDQKTFYWNVSVTNSTGIYNYTLGTNNQTIYKGTVLSITNACPAGTSYAMNFSSYWEQNLSNVNMSANYYITYGLAGSIGSYTLNGSITNVGNLSICINNSQPYYDITYGEIDYSVVGATNRRYYIFENTRVTNTSIAVPIYALETTNSTSFLFTAQTTTLIPYKNYYIGLLRWYPSINSYNLVDMGKTDDSGQTVLNVKTEDVDYRIGLYEADGTLVKLLNSIRFICQTNPCTYSVSVDPNPLDLTSYTNIQSNLSFNPTSKIFTFTWNDPSQASQTMNITVYKGDDAICTSSASGYTGVITCDVSLFTGSLIANVYRTASPTLIFSQLLAEIRQTFVDAGGAEIGLFIGAILLILFALIGSFNPVLVVILGIIALVPLFILGNITMEILMAIGVLGGVIIHFMKRTNG